MFSAPHVSRGLPTDSSSASSPFSSAMDSSPEATTVSSDPGADKSSGKEAATGHIDKKAEPTLSPISSNPPSRDPQISTSTSSSAPQKSPYGSRFEAPRRRFEVDQLEHLDVPLDKLLRSTTNAQVMMQGDPQFIRKQRVETAIRVVLDLLYMLNIPPTPKSPIPGGPLSALLPHDAAGNFTATVKRLLTFRVLRLQAGTATKLSSKKSLSGLSSDRERTAYLETAVYAAGESGRRVYACKRCRHREAKRRESRPIAKKGPPIPVSNAQDVVLPSSNHIAGFDGDRYDPLKQGQIVLEPPWDPDNADWRHEMIMFNTSAEVPIVDGSISALPFRVICYGKCHGEKTGFRVRFNLKTYDGRLIASDITHPVRITDDHKTDKTGPKPAPIPRTQRNKPQAPSRTQSPTPSESGASVTSEAGAISQKQTPSIRSHKPYDRPKAFNQAFLPNSDPDWPGVPINAASSALPNTLSRPEFELSSRNHMASQSRSASSSMASSPTGALQPLNVPDGILTGGFQSLGSAVSVSALAADLQRLHHSSLRDTLAPVPNFQGLSGAGVYGDSPFTSSLTGEFSGFDDGSSGAVSDPGVDSAMDYLDFSEVEEADDTGMAPLGGEPKSLDNVSRSSPSALSNAQLSQIISALSSGPTITITTVIPSMGPVAGGIDIALPGTGFTPNTQIMFGDRPAETVFHSDGFVQCKLPPHPVPGPVEVTVLGANPSANSRPVFFTYEGMTQEIMRLAIQAGALNQAHLGGSAHSFDPSHPFITGMSGQGDIVGPQNGGDEDLDDTFDTENSVIDYLSSLKFSKAGQRRLRINKTNVANQSLLHVAVVMGFENLVRQAITLGAEIDKQDVNGFTPLSFAAFFGRPKCAQILIDSSAAYDLPTTLGESPLDLAQRQEHAELQSLLLSAVWASEPAETGPSSPAWRRPGTEGSVNIELDSDETVSEAAREISEIDEDNPSSDSGDDISRILRSRRRGSRKSLIKHLSNRVTSQSRLNSRRPSIDAQVYPTLPVEDPPPYTPPADLEASWVSRLGGLPYIDQIAQIAHAHGLSDALLARLPFTLPTDKSGVLSATPPQSGWTAVPTELWETIHRLTSPDSMMTYGHQAVATAFAAVSLNQPPSGSAIDDGDLTDSPTGDAKKQNRRIASGTNSKKAQAVKSDKMLLYFWLPILLFTMASLAIPIMLFVLAFSWLIVPVMMMCLPLLVLCWRPLVRYARQTLHVPYK